MHLTKLEAFGFKSFADKVTFDFEPGFTCLVGPNGCGKSNVVDAMKWVLGEQSAKSLRGGEMLDVIFNGSAHRKPLNFCEVTLTFSNECSTLPINAPEVSVSRRLYRSGESEYMINKALCRLRDVRELFWDTGIGTSSYSIIEQGRIGMLLEANVKERRVLFEEAAGIHKYKERKKIALRKLERVEQNLARLNDILQEVERNLRSVTRQAEKARKAKEISDELRTIKLDILLNDAFHGINALREAEGGLASARDQVASLGAELSLAQSSTLEEQETMSRLDDAYTAAQSALSETRTVLAALDEALRGEKAAVDEMTSEEERSRAQAAEAGQKAAALSNEREKTELDVQTTRESLDRSKASASSLAESLSSDQAVQAETARELDQVRRASLDAMGRKAQHQQALTQNEAALGGIDYQIRRSRAEIAKAEDLIAMAQRESEDVKQRQEQIRKRREALEREQAGLRTLQARAEEELDRLGVQGQELSAETEKRRSRRAILEELTLSGEGLSAGVRELLSFTREGAPDAQAYAPGVYGLMPDCLGVEPRMEAAIESALGTHIETLVVDESAMAHRFLDRLREGGLGRATVLPLDRIHSPVLGALMTSVPGCLGRAADLVNCDPRFRVAAEAMLGDVLVFENLAAAEADLANEWASGFHGAGGSATRTTLERPAESGETLESRGEGSGVGGQETATVGASLAADAQPSPPVGEGRDEQSESGVGGAVVVESFGAGQPERNSTTFTPRPRWRRVTLQGDLLDTFGAVSGGRYRQDRLGPIGRRNEIVKLGIELDELSLKAISLSERTAVLERRAQQWARDDERIGSELNSLASTSTELKGILAAIAREEARSSEGRQAAAVEIKQLEAERDANMGRIASLKAELDTLKEQETALSAKSEALSADLAQREEKVSQGRAALEEAKRDASSLAAKLEGLERHVQSLSSQFAERTDERDRSERRAQSLAARREQTLFSIAEKETRRGDLALKQESLDTQVRTLAADKDAARGRFDQARNKERAVSSQLEQAREQHAEIERKCVELNLRNSQKTEQARTEFHIDAEAELAARGGPPQLDPEAQAKAQALDERLQRMGPVNMYALEEQKSLEERQIFLRTQFDDLESARASLKDVIARINKRSRKQFQDTFETVRLNFQEIFRKLFGGGKADLVLEESEDILEAGIEIFARPPGKEPRSIMQLSGGEKAMTTIALLFAVFRSRPAPFCILDEVDAPLDEANVERYNLIIREFLDRSQFLVITHNKKTMSHGDVLYGITMPEPGVSKRIAIRYSDLEKHLPMDEIEKQSEEARAQAQQDLEKAAERAEVKGDALPETIAVEEEQPGTPIS